MAGLESWRRDQEETPMQSDLTGDQMFIAEHLHQRVTHRG